MPGLAIDRIRRGLWGVGPGGSSFVTPSLSHSGPGWLARLATVGGWAYRECLGEVLLPMFHAQDAPFFAMLAQGLEQTLRLGACPQGRPVQERLARCEV
jgi:hypothetical protein